MTNNSDEKQLNTERQYDTLEQALVARPVVRAPRNTVSRVMAQIAALPQQVPVTTFVPPQVIPIKYAPPVALPLPEVDEEGQRLHRSVTKVVVTATWVSLCALFIYLLVWPAASNLFLGGNHDFNIVGSLIRLWTGLVGTVGAVFNAVAPVLPSLLSAVVGLAIMLLIFSMQRWRLRTE
jgi:hypothetical protein